MNCQRNIVDILSRLNLQIFGQPNKQTREIIAENAFDGRQSTKVSLVFEDFKFKTSEG